MFKTGDHLLQRLQATQARQAARQEQRPSQYSLQVEILSDCLGSRVLGGAADCEIVCLPQPSSVRSCMLCEGARGQAACRHLARQTACCQAVHWATEMASVHEEGHTLHGTLHLSFQLR